MTLSAVTQRGMLYPNGRHRPRAHMASNAVASHLKIMWNGGWSPGKSRSAQTGGCDAYPIIVDKLFGLCHCDMALSASNLFRVGRYGRISFKFFRPTTFGMTGKTLNWG